MAYHQTYRLMEQNLRNSGTVPNLVWEWDKAPKEEEVQNVARNLLQRQNRTSPNQLYVTQFTLMQEPADGTPQKKEKEIRSFTGWDAQKPDMDLHRSSRYGMLYLEHTDSKTQKRSTVLLDTYDYLEHHQFTTEDYLQNIAEKLKEKGITPTKQDRVSVLNFQINPAVSTVDRNTGMVVSKVTGEVRNPMESDQLHPVFSLSGDQVVPKFQNIYSLRCFVPMQSMKVLKYWPNQKPKPEELQQAYQKAANLDGVPSNSMLFYSRTVLNRSVCTLNSYGQIVPAPGVQWSKGVQSRNETQGNLYQGFGEVLERRTAAQIREETRELINGEGKPRSKKDWVQNSVSEETSVPSRHQQRRP